MQEQLIEVIQLAIERAGAANDAMLAVQVLDAAFVNAIAQATRCDEGDVRAALASWYGTP